MYGLVLWQSSLCQHQAVFLFQDKFRFKRRK
jgi:hypothetical protein